MLSENIRRMREARGLSQVELAAKLNVVRQTVSKWERGLSVPDSELLVCLSEALETPVGDLLGETVPEPEADDLAAIAAKLEVVNEQLARGNAARRRALLILLGTIFAATLLLFALLAAMGSPYLSWDLGDPETAVAGTLLHGFEWVFFRVAPLVIVAAAAGLVVMWRRGRG